MGDELFKSVARGLSGAQFFHPFGIQGLACRYVHWAKTYLKQAKLLEQPKRGSVQISARGLEILQTSPSKIDGTLLLQFDEFRTFVGKPKIDEGLASQPTASVPLEPYSTTPEEQIASSYPGPWWRH